MKGYYEGYSYVGYMPDGTKRRFATECEYVEAYREERSVYDGRLKCIRDMFKGV